MNLKIIAVTILSVVCFAMPQRISAWDYSKVGDPCKVFVHVKSNNTVESDYKMAHDGEKWFVDFTTTADNNGEIKFVVESFYDDDSSLTQRPWDGDYGGPVGNWINYNDTNYDDNGACFKVTNLRGNSVYRLELKNCEQVNSDTGTYNGFQYFVWRMYPSPLYLYNSNPKQIGVAEAVDDVYTYTVYLEEGTYVGLAENGNRTDFDQLGTRFGTPVENTGIPASDLEVVRDGDNHMWRASKTGLYTISFNRSTGRMSAVCKDTDEAGEKLYLYGSDSGWTTRLGEGVRYSDGTYSFYLYVNPKANGYVAFSTNPDAEGWDDMAADGYKRYTPAIDGVVGNGGSYPCVESERGSYMIEADGTYTFIVNLAEKKVDVAVVPDYDRNVNLPLKREDFGNGRKHYFLVGERCGAWYLQPEWELAVDENNTTATLGNRFMYDGYIGVGVVDNYDDYKVHRYTFFSNYEYKIHRDANTPGLEKLGTVAIQPGQSIYKSPDNGGLVINYDGSANEYGLFNQTYWDGYGQFVTAITVDLDSDGNPTGIRFTEGTDKEQAENRVFTLCGDNIYNRNYSIDSGVGTTCRANHDRKATTDGWQEGWIQYDPVTKKPYVDGNGEYLYHTSFTPDYLTTHPVYFNMETRAGEFQFTNEAIQFVEASKLPDFDRDPYRNFYSAFTGTEEIGGDGSTIKAGDGFSFYPVIENDNPVTVPTNEWHCYVIRDMWMGGQYKFWSGWGGNIHETNGVPDEPAGATWHGPNGGPDMPEHGRKRTLGFDVTTGDNVVLYKNAQNRGDANYFINETDDDRTPRYFNRVILWYNESRDGVGQSYIQLIQEQAGPAVFAQKAENQLSGKNNYIRYKWYLDATDADDEYAEVNVLGYVIRRYALVDNEYSFTGYPEGEYVDISQMGLKVRDLYGDTENETAKSIMEFTDKSVNNSDDGFNPGVYRYEITVTYDKIVNGSYLTKDAVSNEVMIDDDGSVNPSPVAYQIIELRDDEGHDGQAELGVSKKYMTYDPAGGACYAFNIDVSDSGVSVPADVEKLDNAEAVAFLAGNPDKCYWTSDYYVRCINKGEFDTRMKSLQDAGVMQQGDLPVPVLTVRETVGENTVTRGNACQFTAGENTYYAMIVKRGGNLAPAEFTVDLSYKYLNTFGSTVNGNGSASVNIYPVMPKPYSPKYRYRYSASAKDMTQDNVYRYGKITVPVQNYINDNRSKQFPYNETGKAFVDLRNLTIHNLTLEIDFSRPNVSKEIFDCYDVNYDVSITNEDNTAVPLDVTARVADRKSNDGFDKRYRIEISGLHPANIVCPRIKFNHTAYTANNGEKPQTGLAYLGNEGRFGNDLDVEASHTVEVNDAKLDNVHLGYIKRESGYDWMYKGHDHNSFSDPDEKLVRDYANELDETEESAITPLYYLIELYNGSDAATYGFLMPHYADHGKDAYLDQATGLLINDSDPMTGAYIAKGFSSDATPSFYATSIYIFERPVAGGSVSGNVEFNDLDVEFIYNNASAAAKGTLRYGSTIPTSGEMMAGGIAELPDAGTVPENVLDLDAPDSATGFSRYVAVKGSTADHTPGGINVTGVDDVLAGYDDSEAVYYNLQGIRVAEPASPGVYIKAQGMTVTKIVIE